ncbi:antitoxin VbhA family protein [Actinobacillus pleuropneumoniae]
MLKTALASFALEGEYPSKECEVLLKKYASGEITTLDELRIRIFEK